MKPLRPITRVLLALVTLAMVSGYFLPLWEIQLWAPQYPEGLNMKIWLDHLSGDFDIINGLNHYIGMRHIKQEMFPEFKFMGYALGFLIAVGFLPVILGKRKWLQAYVMILFLGAGLGIYDFYRWGHDYGHNLDPKAAISVPGMTYDPPLIGYKSLLNFVAYSGPDKGGWVLVGSGATATALLLWEMFLVGRKSRRNAGVVTFFSMLSIMLLLPGCDTGPQPIEYGKDACSNCKMILADKHYGTQFISGKGKIFKFDDVNCMIEFMAVEPAKSDTAGKAFIVDFNRANEFLPVQNTVFLKHPKLRSPMGSHIAGFASADAATSVKEGLGGNGQSLTWADVLKTP
jgi:copper chaperone NosL